MVRWKLKFPESTEKFFSLSTSEESRIEGRDKANESDFSFHRFLLFYVFDNDYYGVITNSKRHSSQDFLYKAHHRNRSSMIFFIEISVSPHSIVAISHPTRHDFPFVMWESSRVVSSFSLIHQLGALHRRTSMSGKFCGRFFRLCLRALKK